MSETVADAAETAPIAPTSALGAAAVCLAPPLGNRTSTTLSQKAIRIRKNMVLPFSFFPLPHPHACFYSPTVTIGATFENAVRRAMQLLRKLAANSSRILLKLERSAIFKKNRMIDAAVVVAVMLAVLAAVSAAVMNEPTEGRRARAGGGPSTVRSPCNTSFTMQLAVHHSARMRRSERGNPAVRRAKIPAFRLP
jgi:hypothetical protein